MCLALIVLGITCDYKPADKKTRRLHSHVLALSVLLLAMVVVVMVVMVSVVVVAIVVSVPIIVQAYVVINFHAYSQVLAIDPTAVGRRARLLNGSAAELYLEEPANANKLDELPSFYFSTRPINRIGCRDPLTLIS